MSQWTHIRGGIEFRSSPYEIKKKGEWYCGSKDVYLPFPQEQLKLDLPKPYITNKKEAGLTFEPIIYSLPRAKKYIDEAIKKLPQGESGWNYSLTQTKSMHDRSSSCFDYPCEEKEFQKQVTKMFNEDSSFAYWDETMNWKYFKDLYNIDVSWVEYINAITIGIREDLRDCSGDELLEALDKFFLELRENDIYVEDGYLEWEDEYNSNHIYAWRCSRVDSNPKRIYRFMKLDTKTNEVIWSKEYQYGTFENGKTDFNTIVAVETSEDKNDAK